MPKLINRNPKMGKLGNYAVVRYAGKVHYLKDPRGRNTKHGTKEALTAYNRFCAELTDCPGSYAIPAKVDTEYGISVAELTAGFLGFAEKTLEKPNLIHYRILVTEFLVPLCDGLPVTQFTPKELKLVRDAMIKAGRFCRNQINDYTRRIKTIFKWGVSELHVDFNTFAALNTLPLLKKGYPGTFENPKRQHVPIEDVRRTEPGMSRTVSAMVQIQLMAGISRPSEVFNMRVGEIDTSGSEFWLYQPGRHKTLEKTGERVIPLDAEEQALIAPYLVGKKPENAVFSPRTAMQELGRKPSKLVGEFYNKNSYKQAIEYAVTKVNKTLPPEQQIPLWTPYQLRHLAGSKMRLEQGVDATQTFLGHASPDTQKHYTHLQVEAMKKLKRETRGQRNPLAGIEEKMS